MPTLARPEIQHGCCMQLANRTAFHWVLFSRMHMSSLRLVMSLGYMSRPLSQVKVRATLQSAIDRVHVTGAIAPASNACHIHPFSCPPLLLHQPHQDLLPSASLQPMHSCQLVLNNGLSQAPPVLNVKSCHCNWYPSPFACVCNHRVSFYSQCGSLSSTTTTSQSKSTTILNPRSQKHPVQVHFSIMPNCNKPRSQLSSSTSLKPSLRMSFLKFRLLCNVLVIRNPPLHFQNGTNK